MGFLDDIQNYRVYFETLTIGERFISPGRTITETDIVNFAALSGDYNQLHTDAQFAATTQHGQRIAHGLLVLSVTSGLSSRLPVMKAMETTLIGLAELKCRWRKPTLIGDTLHVVMEVVEKTESRKPDRGTVLLRRMAVNQHGDAVLESDWSLVLQRATLPPS